VGRSKVGEQGEQGKQREQGKQGKQRGYEMNALKDKVINIEFRGRHYRLSRLNDNQYYERRQNSISIADDYGFYTD